MRIKRRKIMRKAMSWMTMLAMGGTAFQLSGCDTATRALVLGGLEAASSGILTALSDALFLGLDLGGRPDDTGSVSGGS